MANKITVIAKIISFMFKFKDLFVLLLGVLAVVSLVWNWKHPVEVPIWHTIPPIIKPVYHTIPGPVQIRIIEKTIFKDKLVLPDWVNKDTEIAIISSGVVSPYRGKTNVLSLLNTRTGEGDLLVKQVPLPIFEFEQYRMVGLRTGFDGKGSKSEVYGEWKFFRVADSHFGLYGDLDTRGDWSVMVQCGIKF